MDSTANSAEDSCEPVCNASSTVRSALPHAELTSVHSCCSSSVNPPRSQTHKKYITCGVVCSQRHRHQQRTQGLQLRREPFVRGMFEVFNPVAPHSINPVKALRKTCQHNHLGGVTHLIEQQIHSTQTIWVGRAKCIIDHHRHRRGCPAVTHQISDSEPGQHSKLLLLSLIHI